MKTNNVIFSSAHLTSYLPLKYPTHFLSLSSDYYAKRKNNVIVETYPQFFAYMYIIMSIYLATCT